jgi:UrcA family protein
MKRCGRAAGPDASLRRRDETLQRESLDLTATLSQADASQQAYSTEDLAMTRTHKNFLAIAVAAFALSAAQAQAETRQTIELAPAVSVHYAAEDLDTDKGAENVYRKLRKASRRVCGIDGGFLNLSEKTLAQKCVNDTLASAVRKIDRPMLTALHDSSSRKVS